MLNFQRLIKSFRCAWDGLKIVWKSEQNFRIQFLIAVFVLALAIWLALPTWKIIALLMISAFVMILELVNSVLERMADAFHPRIHQTVEEMKDIMAATVLLAALGAVIIGIILFWSHLASLLK